MKILSIDPGYERVGIAVVEKSVSTSSRNPQTRESDWGVIKKNPDLSGFFVFCSF
jgi:Holliday junction resolvasome RuvABC endonuclease subunit